MEIFVPREMHLVRNQFGEYTKTLEYVMQVMEERVRVEESYSVGLSKIQGMLNFVKEQMSGAFECQVLRMNVSHRVSHTCCLVEQMKAEIEETRIFLKISSDKQKICENFCKESERSFKASLYELDKQKKELSSASKDLEEASLAVALISADPAKTQPKWKERRDAAISRLKQVESAKTSLENLYRADIDHTDEQVESMNIVLQEHHTELVAATNTIQESIYDLARKQLAFEVSHLKNIQYDLDSFIKQVEQKHKVTFVSQITQLAERSKHHKPLAFLTFLSDFTEETLLAFRITQEQEKLAEETHKAAAQEQPFPSLAGDLPASPIKKHEEESKEETEAESEVGVVTLVSEEVEKKNPYFDLEDTLFDCIAHEDRLAAQRYFQSALLGEDQLAAIAASEICNETLRSSAVYLVNSVVVAKGECVDLEVDTLDISVLLSQIKHRSGKAIKQQETHVLLEEPITEEYHHQDQQEEIQKESPIQEELLVNEPIATESAFQQELTCKEASSSIDYQLKESQCLFLTFLESFRQSSRSQISLGQYNQLVCECFKYLDAVMERKCEVQVKKFMPLSFAIYRLSAVDKVYIYERVRHHNIWTIGDLWEALIITAVRGDLSKLPAEFVNDESMYRATVHSNLAAIGINMLKFRQTKTTTKNILGRLAQTYGLLQGGIAELLTFIEQEGDKEKALTFVINKHVSISAYQSNPIKGRIVKFGSSLPQTNPPPQQQSHTSTDDHIQQQQQYLQQQSSSTQAVSAKVEVNTTELATLDKQPLPQLPAAISLPQVVEQQQQQQPVQVIHEGQIAQVEQSSSELIAQTKPRANTAMILGKSKVNTKFFGFQGTSTDFAINKLNKQQTPPPPPPPPPQH